MSDAIPAYSFTVAIIDDLSPSFLGLAPKPHEGRMRLSRRPSGYHVLEAASMMGARWYPCRDAASSNLSSLLPMIRRSAPAGSIDLRDSGGLPGSAAGASFETICMARPPSSQLPDAQHSDVITMHGAFYACLDVRHGLKLPGLRICNSA